MSFESFLKKQPKWLQIMIAAVFFGGCVVIISFKINSSFASEETPIVAPNLSSFKVVDSKGWSKKDFERANAALATWAKQCPVYMKYPDEVTLQKVSIEKNEDSSYDNHGWNSFVRIETVAAIHPHKLMKISPYISGHHCFHDIGTEGSAGISVAKSMCIALCENGVVASKTHVKFFPVKN